MPEQREVQQSLAVAASFNPRAFRLYRGYADKVWTSADIDPRTTEIIATAITHITRCSYCVSYHTLKATSLGVTPAELVEAGVLMAALQGAAVAHAFNDTLNETLGLEPLPQDPFLELPFNDAVTALEPKTKALAVLGGAFVLRDPVLLRPALAKARELGATPAEISKSQRIAVALVAGATVRHLAEVSDACNHG